MKRSEYVAELHALIDSFDKHVGAYEVEVALNALADRLYEEGFEDE